MKVLFYLPVITPWWFDHIVEPLIRCMAAGAEVSVLAPTPWRNTGISQREIDRLADLPEVQWLIIHGEEHPSTRTAAAGSLGLADFVQDLSPDYVFCRSADFETVAGFPGTVRFIAEAGAPPFSLPAHWVSLQQGMFAHGVIPELPEQDWQQLEAAFAPIWSALRVQVTAGLPSREQVFAAAALRPDQPVLLLPLEYEHEENFFLAHRVGARPNHLLVKEIAERLPPGCTLAVTDHPLNTLYVDNSALSETIAALGENVVLVEGNISGHTPTMALASHADAMLLGDSKVFALAGFLGVPMLRRSRFESGSWLNAYSDLDAMLRDLEHRHLAAPDTSGALRWFAYHLANDSFDPQDRALTPEELRSRMDRRTDPARWAAAYERLRALQPEPV